MEDINYKRLKNLSKFRFLEKDIQPVVKLAQKYSTVVQPTLPKKTQNYSTLGVRKKSFEKSTTLTRPREKSIENRPKSSEKSDIKKRLFLKFIHPKKTNDGVKNFLILEGTNFSDDMKFISFCKMLNSNQDGLKVKNTIHTIILLNCNIKSFKLTQIFESF